MNKPKCKWEAGKLIPCKSGYENYMDLGKPYFGRDLRPEDNVNFCPFCGTDIKTPANPIVIISGKTFVGYYNNINYFCIRPKYWLKLLKDYPEFEHPEAGYFNAADFWKPFSQIELTDEIAILRPMVFLKATRQRREQLDMLIYVNNINQPMTAGGWTAPARLATVQELIEYER